MIDCSLCCVIAAALLGSMLYFTLYQKNDTILVLTENNIYKYKID